MKWRLALVSGDRWDVDARRVAIGAGLYLLAGVAAYFIPEEFVLPRLASAVVVAFGALYGAVVGAAVGFVGGVMSDVFYGSVWWHWDVGLGILGGLAGLGRLGGSVGGADGVAGDVQKARIGARRVIKAAALALAGTFGGMYFAGLIDVLAGTPAETALGNWAWRAAVANAVFGATLGPMAAWLAADEPTRKRLRQKVAAAFAKVKTGPRR